MDKIEFHVYDETFDADLILVVTEWHYTPKKPHTFHEEGWPEEVEVIGGYVMCDSPDEEPERIECADLKNHIDAFWDKVSGDLYAQAREHYEDDQLEAQLDRIS